MLLFMLMLLNTTRGICFARVACGLTARAARVSRWVGLVLRLVLEVFVWLSRMCFRCVPAPPGVFEPVQYWSGGVSAGRAGP